MKSSKSWHEDYLKCDQIDRICDDFEALLRDGSRPRIEDFLAQAPETARNDLLKELIILELETLESSLDASSKFALYRSRFPQAASMLEALCIERYHVPDPDQYGISGQVDRIRESVVPPDVPQRFRHFELRSVIGTGSFGVVWHAWDLRLQRDVALKFPREDQTSSNDQSFFLREARVAAKLNHPNIVPVFEVNDEEQEFFIASELIEGPDLKAYLATKSLKLRESAMLIAKMATALEHAHALGVVHRDLKPANVIMDLNDEPHITDFGLAKKDESEQPLAAAGQIVGTPAYMSPEQTRGDNDLVDRRTDVYSLGVMLYEMLCGTLPFRGELSVVLQKISSVAPQPPRSIRPDIPKALEAICLKCLSKEPAMRYQSARALADDLQRFVNGEPLCGIPATMSERIGKWFHRNRVSIMAVTATVVLTSSWVGSRGWNLSPSTSSVELRQVEFRTEPPGCEVTVVAIDPATGEPDPRRIEHASGLTPVVMNLKPADYLVVAVLNDRRFHEVFRHVPETGEKVPYGHPHLFWRLSPDGVLKLLPVRIPPAELPQAMTFVEGADRLVEAAEKQGDSGHVWHLPGFYVDAHEMSSDELVQLRADWKDADLSSNRPATLVYPRCISVLEGLGKRPPSAAELYYLSSIVCPSESCVLPGGSRITGLHAGLWEWTTTKPGGPFSESLPMPPGLDPSMQARIIGGGPSNPESPHTPTRLRSNGELITGLAGLRGVRSARPRRSPHDFLAPSADSSGNASIAIGGR